MRGLCAPVFALVVAVDGFFAQHVRDFLGVLAPPTKEKRTRSAGRIAGMAAGIAVGVLAAAYLAVCIAAAAGRTTLHRTQVLGVDVGGLTAQEVRDKWQRDGADACSGEVIHLTLGEETIGQVSLSLP